MTSPMTTEQRVDHLTDAIGDLSQQQRDAILNIREVRSDIHHLRESVIAAREVQVEHSRGFRHLETRLEAMQAEHSKRLGNIETLLVEILASLPERPAS